MLAVGRVLTILLVYTLMFNVIYQDILNFQVKDIGLRLEGLVVFGKLSCPNVVIPKVKVRRSKSALTVPTCRRLMIGVHLLKYALSGNILLLCNDIELNPGPVAVDSIVSIYRLFT